MQTHTKSSSKAKPSLQSIAPDQAMLAAAVEPPPFGTFHAVGTNNFHSLYCVGVAEGYIFFF